MATKEEKALFKAVDARLELLMLDNGFKTYSQVIRTQRGKKTAASNLIRAAALLAKSRERRSARRGEGR